MKYILLSIIQTVTNSNAISESQESIVMASEASCKTLQQRIIPQPSSSTDYKLVYIDKSGAKITTHTVICSPQGE